MNPITIQQDRINQDRIDMEKSVLAMLDDGSDRLMTDSATRAGWTVRIAQPC
jgi:hypothetical protein